MANIRIAKLYVKLFYFTILFKYVQPYEVRDIYIIECIDILLTKKVDN